MHHRKRAVTALCRLLPCSEEEEEVTGGAAGGGQRGPQLPVLCTHRAGTELCLPPTTCRAYPPSDNSDGLITCHQLQVMRILYWESVNS